MLRLAEFELGTGILWFHECAPVTTIKSQYYYNLPSFHFTVFVAMSLAGQTRSFTHCVTLLCILHELSCIASFICICSVKVN